MLEGDNVGTSWGPIFTGLVATNTTLNVKMNKVKGKIPNISNLGTTTTTALTDVENKIPNVSNLVKKN